MGSVQTRMPSKQYSKQQGCINEGYQHIVDIDLKSFFDEVEHCLLLELLYRKVKCPLTLRLIRKWLTAPIQIDGKLTKRRKGVPQGSPLSPLLSNIMLNELDKQLERQGFAMSAMPTTLVFIPKVNKQPEGQATIYLFFKNKLKLPINREKSGIRKPVNFTILGFGFVPTYVKGEKGKYQLVVSDKGWKTLKRKLKTITRKTTPALLTNASTNSKRFNEDGSDTTEWQVFRANSKNSMAGCATG